MNIELKNNNLGKWIIVYNDGKQVLTGKRVTHGNWEGYEFFGDDGVEGFKTDIDVAAELIDGKSLGEIARIVESAIRDSEFSYRVFGGSADTEDKTEYDFS